jgi:hypothetical protein
MDRARAVEVLIVSLGSTSGLRVADEELRGSLERAGARVALERAGRPRELRTLMLTDLAWARAARAAAVRGLREHRPHAVIYSTITAALLWPVPGAIYFDVIAAVNRRGRHGLWQRPLERARLRAAPLLLPQSEAGLIGTPQTRAPDRALVLPVPVEPSGPLAAERDIAAITYAANPETKGLDRVLRAWAGVRRGSEELLVAGASEAELRRAGITIAGPGVRLAGRLPAEQYRALLRRSRAFVCAPTREGYGIAQLEALVDGCMLVTTRAAGPYVALSIARELDPRLVGEDLAAALRTALDDPAPGYSERAREALAPFRRGALDAIVAERLLPRLLPSG